MSLLPLRRCPFCAREASLEEVDEMSSSTRGVRFSVGCDNEDCIGWMSVRTFARRSEAIAAWNLLAPRPVGLSEEDYLLVCQIEECAEVIHAVCKALRFGLLHTWPERSETNREAICGELRDLMVVANRLKLATTGPDKGEKFERMMEMSRQLGRLK